MKRPRIVRPSLAQQHEAFRLVDQIMSTLTSGEIEAVRGVPCFRDAAADAHTWYAVSPALEGWLALWAALVQHYRLQIALRPVEAIAQRLAADTPITPDMVEAAQRVVSQCRSAYRSMDIYTVGALRQAVVQRLRSTPQEAAA